MTTGHKQEVLPGICNGKMYNLIHVASPFAKKKKKTKTRESAKIIKQNKK